MEFKTLLTNKALKGLAPSYLMKHLGPYLLIRALCCHTAGLLVVSRVSKAEREAKLVSYQTSLLWNQFLVSVREPDTLFL